MSRFARPLAAALGLTLLVTTAACGDDDDETSTTAPVTEGGDTTAAAGGGTETDLSGQSITVGSANFPESVLLAEMYAGALEAAGAEVSVQPNIGSREVYYAAIESGEIDLLPEYTGSLLAFISEEDPEAKTTEDQITALQEQLPEGLTVLDASQAQNKDVIVCNAETTGQYGLSALSDLEENGPQIVLGGPPEFAERSPFGIPGFAAAGITFKEFQPLEIGPPLFEALTQNAVNCANLFSTDTFIADAEVTALEDDIQLSGDESVLPLIREEKATPEVTEVLNRVNAALDTDGLIALNTQVQNEGLAESEVAAQWLEENGFIA